MSNDEVNRIIAEWVGPEGFEPDRIAMRFTDSGVITETMQTPMTGNAEIAILKGKPLDYCSDLNLAMETMRGKLPLVLATDADGLAFASVYTLTTGLREDGRCHDKEPSKALAHALAEAIKVAAARLEASK